MPISDPFKSSKKEKILIIEGHVIFGQQIADRLNQNGFEAILVKNGIEAMKMLYDKLPRLVILNAILPDTDSYQILEKKNAEPLLKKIPVFLISTQGMPINMNKIPQGSVAEFVLLFQADAAELVARVKRYLAGPQKSGLPGHNVANVTTPLTTPLSSIKDSPKVPTTISDGRIKLLWVEDDKLITNILGKKFVAAGFDLLHVVNGDAALKALETFTPNAIVLDLMLPGIGGLEILQKIDMNPKLKMIPVMILSNLDKDSDRNKAKMLGAKKFLVKAGTSLDQIAEEIKQMCN
jgi:DNA-binding response OmpR family regulator